NTHRMVREYTEQFYLPSGDRFAKLEANSAVAARTLAAWLAKVKSEWPGVRILGIENCPDEHAKVGDLIGVRVGIKLGVLTASDLTVELYLGTLDSKGEITQPATFPMHYIGIGSAGEHRFEATGAPCCR